MLPFKGKQYTAKLVSKELGSIDEAKPKVIKLLKEIPGLVFWSAGSSNAFSEGNTDHCLCNEL